MEIGSWAEIVDATSSLVVGAVGAAIAALLYGLNKAQLRDAWMQAYRETNEAFWNDTDMLQVRAWLAHDAEYKKISPLLQCRCESTESMCVSRDELVVLDTLDKFLNLMVRVVAIDQTLRSEHGQNQWRSLFFGFWIAKCTSDSRLELRNYIARYYPELATSEMFRNGGLAHQAVSTATRPVLSANAEGRSVEVRNTTLVRADVVATQRNEEPSPTSSIVARSAEEVSRQE